MGDEKLIALLLMQQIAVLFLIMGLGFLIVKLGIVKTEDSRVLSMVTIYLVLPCVTIHAFQIEYSTKIRNGFLLAVVVAILIHVVLFMVCGILRKLLKMEAFYFPICYRVYIFWCKRNLHWDMSQLHPFWWYSPCRKKAVS